MQTTVKLMALLLLLLIPNIIQAEQKPWEHVTGMWIPPGPTNPRNLSLTMNPSMKEFPKGFTILMRVYDRPVMCVVMPIGVCLQAVAGTPMAIMPSCSSTDLSWPV